MLINFEKVLSLALLAGSVSGRKHVPRGFVTTSGTKFQLDGKDFYFAGSNAYYFPFNDVRKWSPCSTIERYL